MALQMNDAQRLQALDAYNPHDRLVQIKAKDGTLKDYYPASWRLYELNLRYPDANFSTEVLFFDMEHDFAIVKARLYLGPDYEMSTKKAEALKQGKLSQLDKLDTAAKAR